jgi:YidC/Oxa1 family membrane protein insertase
LPLLLQMPILYSMWSVLRTSIDLRQADFIWWITDLSLPDTIVTFPVAILGIKHISGLALLMGVTLFFQQKLTITDPRQKALVYMMPIMFTLMFSNFPAGLNLYYFMFNLLGIIQQIYINKFSRKRLTLEDLKKMPKKEGWIQKKMKQAQEIAESQGKSAPNAPYQNTKSKYARKKKKK